ncbi:hypothetical protein Cgig2_014703 [Carnegiea gigantea]|uniref:RNase H type-1 domain-containing protein n=1 Tax=Carnegiea gigantea TaxID=171969 RepID=A0A9Q1QUP4_9CARY|nr:hypothetical protein Cgig2_014703 [Carnegiea gigantea]
MTEIYLQFQLKPMKSMLSSCVATCPAGWGRRWGDECLAHDGSLENGSQIDIWGSRWLPRPKSFTVITAKPKNPQVTKQATSFVRSYRASLKHDQTIGDLTPSLWQLPASRMYKLNFDGGCVGERGWGWGFVIHNSNGDIVMAGVQQGTGFAGLEVEEARACIFGLKKATAAGLINLVIEGDCLSLIQKLKNKQVPNNVLGFFIQEVLRLVSFCIFLHVCLLNVEATRSLMNSSLATILLVE